MHTEKDMFYEYDNIDPDYIPNNRDRHLFCDIYKETIIRGTTPTHSFDLDFSINEVKELLITYQQSLKNLLELKKEDVTITEAEDHLSCVLSYTLSEAETNLFKATDRNTPVYVQIRVQFNDDEVIASDWYRMKVLESLDSKPFDELN